MKKIAVTNPEQDALERLCEQIVDEITEGQVPTASDAGIALESFRAMERADVELPASFKVLASFTEHVLNMALDGRSKDIVTAFGLGRLAQGQAAEQRKFAAAFHDALRDAGCTRDAALELTSIAFDFEPDTIAKHVTAARNGAFGIESFESAKLFLASFARYFVEIDQRVLSELCR